MAEIKYNRLLLKLSGESLSNNNITGIAHSRLAQIASDIVEAKDLGVDIGIVIGGGNIFRGSSKQLEFIDRVSADHMGMLATIINSLALQGYLEKRGLHTRVMSAVNVSAMAEPYIRRRAIRHLEKAG